MVKGEMARGQAEDIVILILAVVEIGLVVSFRVVLWYFHVDIIISVSRGQDAIQGSRQVSDGLEDGLAEGVVLQILERLGNGGRGIIDVCKEQEVVLVRIAVSTLSEYANGQGVGQMVVSESGDNLAVGVAALDRDDAWNSCLSKPSARRAHAGIEAVGGHGSNSCLATVSGCCKVESVPSVDG